MDLKHCQICERDIKANTGLIAHYGYQRPYQEGWRSSSCWGARHLPYEVSCDAIQPCIDSMAQYVERQTKINEDLMANPPETLTEVFKYISMKPKTYTRPEGFDAKTLDEGRSYPYHSYENEFLSHIKLHRREIENTNRAIKKLEKRLADWRPQK